MLFPVDDLLFRTHTELYGLNTELSTRKKMRVRKGSQGAEYRDAFESNRIANERRKMVREINNQVTMQGRKEKSIKQNEVHKKNLENVIRPFIVKA